MEQFDLFGGQVKKRDPRPAGIPIPSIPAAIERPAGSAGYSMPVLQVRGKSILTYCRVESDGCKALQMLRSANMELQRLNAYSGEFTAGAKKRCRKAINLMVQGTRRRWIVNPITKRMQLHQLSFITLTVSDTGDLLDGCFAYSKLLSPFLSWLRKTKGVNTYVWKAERQINEQIHYHLTLPDFIHYQEIRKKWNALQKKAGIIARYRKNQQAFHKDGFRVREDLLEQWPEVSQRAAYERGVATNWEDPNSTDVHKVFKVKDLAAYLSKEFGKTLQNQKGRKHYAAQLEDELPRLIAEGDTDRYLQMLKLSSNAAKVWDCSANLSKGKYFSVEMKQQQFEYLERAVKEGVAKKFEGEMFCIYKFQRNIVDETFLTKEDLKHYQAWLHVLRESITYNDPQQDQENIFYA